MGINNNIKKETCKMKSGTGYCPKPLEKVLGFLSKKWAISIIVTIGNFKKLRFNNLSKKLEKPTAKILSERLKELENNKIIERKAYKQLPPKVEYSLTKSGKEIFQLLLPLIKWAEKKQKIPS